MMWWHKALIALAWFGIIAFVLMVILGERAPMDPDHPATRDDEK
jgi:cation transporter-like permease